MFYEAVKWVENNSDPVEKSLFICVRFFIEDLELDCIEY
jgi:hypothetical protein